MLSAELSSDETKSTGMDKHFTIKMLWPIFYQSIFETNDYGIYLPFNELKNIKDTNIIYPFGIKITKNTIFSEK